ncbi:CAP domain-containing protein [Cohnella kolymensis]|uniref:CAP domain-containing protein n=1 Tax=Cohnella kolymensis TaxID=1590652 RepID=UPI000697E996
MKKSLFAVMLSMSLAAVFTSGGQASASTPAIQITAGVKVSSPTQTLQSQTTYAKQVVTLVNRNRAKAGLKPVTLSTKLSAVAKAKAIDLYTNDYFDHISPIYGSPFKMMKAFGITYNYAGENIARGQKTPQAVVTAWMNSPGHRANIMNKHYKYIGMSYYKGGWVQQFIG